VALLRGRHAAFEGGATRLAGDCDSLERSGAGFPELAVARSPGSEEAAFSHEIRLDSSFGIR
jgi:hypothetical protein